MSLRQKKYAERRIYWFSYEDWLMGNVTSTFIMTHDQFDCYL